MPHPYLRRHNSPQQLDESDIRGKLSRVPLDSHDMYELVDAPPDVAAYCRLRKACGMSEIDAAAAAIGLADSWIAVTIRRGEEIIGMGRIVGDGG